LGESASPSTSTRGAPLAGLSSSNRRGSKDNALKTGSKPRSIAFEWFRTACCKEAPRSYVPRVARVNRDAAAQVIEVLNVRPDDKVLEVGFESGDAIQLLLHHIPAGSVAGVDQSQEMVRQAAARNGDALRSRKVDLRYGSVERLPFAMRACPGPHRTKNASRSSPALRPSLPAAERKGRVPRERIVVGLTADSAAIAATGGGGV
jgi:SAM-dependent methyltransferase